VIDSSGAERALERLRQSSAEVSDAIIAAEVAAFRLKEMEAIVVEELWKEKVPTTLIPKLIFKDSRVLSAGAEKAKAVAYLGSLNAGRKADETEISIYQSRVKDRT
jgi:hypothetical protein